VAVEVLLHGVLASLPVPGVCEVLYDMSDRRRCLAGVSQEIGLRLHDLSNVLDREAGNA
jgi:hypothetical protein